jgi:hypothetical protein
MHELATAIEQFVIDPFNGAKGLARVSRVSFIIV